MQRRSSSSVAAMVRSLIRRPAVVAGIRRPVGYANGMAYEFHRNGDRTLIMAGGVAMACRRSPPTYGVPRAGPLIIPSQTGEARTEAGVIRSRTGLEASLSRLGDRCSVAVLKCCSVAPVWRGERYPRAFAGDEQIRREPPGSRASSSKRRVTAFSSRPAVSWTFCAASPRYRLTWPSRMRRCR